MVLPLPALLTVLPLCRPLPVDAAASVQAPHDPAGAAAAVPGDPRPLPLRLLGPRPLPALCSGGELRQPPWGRVRAHHRRPQLHHEVRKGRRGGGRERGACFLNLFISCSFVLYCVLYSVLYCVLYCDCKLLKAFVSLQKIVYPCGWWVGRGRRVSSTIGSADVLNLIMFDEIFPPHWLDNWSCDQQLSVGCGFVS